MSPSADSWARTAECPVLAAPAARDVEAELHDAMNAFALDPLGFVRFAYKWPIKGEGGPDVWQAEVLEDIGRQVRASRFTGVTPVLPLRFGTSSGHGIGKSALCAWLVDWIMSTRRNAQGTITANTNEQLEKKTWAAVREWTARCITRHWFEINSAIMYRVGARGTWFCSPQSCAEENSEAFAGQHAKDSSSFYIFDEASAIPDKIWEVAEGGLTDGEPMIFAWGNPTRNTGKFHTAAFGSGRDRWTIRVIDSRDCKFSNKALIREWQEDYGEDSDFFRVRVRGLPPRASSLTLIDQDRIWAAQQRTEVIVLPDEPLVVGVDFSGGGAAWNVVRFRRGADARSIPPIRIPGEQTRHDRSGFLALLAQLLQDKTPHRRIAMMFCDSAFGAPYVERLQAMGFRNVMEINNGVTTTPDKFQNVKDPQVGKGPVLELKAENMRAYTWLRMKEWLRTAAIDPKDTHLEADLAAPGYHLNKSDRLVLESKQAMQDRGVASPDDADALALTFAAPVLYIGKPVPHPHARRGRFEGRRSAPGGPAHLGWMG